VAKFGEEPVDRHDVYAGNGLSGELTVQIVTATPVFVGGQRTRNPSPLAAALVEPYEVGGRPAIPATSLRGLLSNTYEIVTGSAMRVFDANKVYSYRMAAESRITFHMIGKVSPDGTSVIAWNQRPASAQYQQGAGVPNALRGLSTWTVEPRMTPSGNGQSVPDYYCLDFGDRHSHMPPGRHYEIRLSPPASPQLTIPIDEKALLQFHRLADECTDASKGEAESRPYQPQGQARGPDDPRYTLKADDFVYFQTNPAGNLVTRLSLAQIWRDDIKASIGEKFGGGNLVPLQIITKNSNAIRNRRDLTLAETAFGFIFQEESEDGTTAKNQLQNEIRAFSSKLIFSDALLTGGVNGASTYLTKGAETLKILASPKPPSAAFYFGPVPGTDRMPSYEQIADGTSKPRGRKMYLHLQEKSIKKCPWKSHNNDHLDQKVAIRCLSKDTHFEFGIAFDNLTYVEFSALCYALQPVPGYLHKLGMGKPLGLGSVALNVAHVRKVDRLNRYSSKGFSTARFTEVAKSGDGWVEQRSGNWRDCVQKYFGAPPNTLMNSLVSLETIGTTRVEKMQYPMTREQSDTEDKLFNWPSNNRRLKREWAQFLRPINSTDPATSQITGRIDPLPWKCYVIVVGNALTQRQCADLRLRAYGCECVTDSSAASTKIAEYRAESPGAVIFVIGMATSIHGLDLQFNGYDVRKVELQDNAGTPEQQEKKRKSNAQNIKNLFSALELGALRSHANQAVGG
jgi:hypothetical protein